LIDSVLDARVDGEPLSEDQRRAWVSMYIGGGAETTRHLIAHGLLTLLEWPDQCRRLAQGADVATAVEEMLRFTTPVMQHARWPLETVEIDGARIEPGQRTTLWMISANRDEAAFPDADRFDIARSPNHHDALGPGGPHYCLGAGLARMEARVLFEELRPHLDRIELAGAPERGQSTMFNILKHLPVRLR
jgi:cytochrome P450